MVRACMRSDIFPLCACVQWTYVCVACLGQESENFHSIDPFSSFFCFFRLHFHFHIDTGAQSNAHTHTHTHPHMRAQLYTRTRTHTDKQIRVEKIFHRNFLHNYIRLCPYGYYAYTLIRVARAWKIVECMIFICQRWPKFVIKKNRHETFSPSCWSNCNWKTKSNKFVVIFLFREYIIVFIQVMAGVCAWRKILRTISIIKFISKSHYTHAVTKTHT